MKRSAALPGASRNLQIEVGLTEFSGVPARHYMSLTAASLPLDPSETRKTSRW